MVDIIQEIIDEELTKSEEKGIEKGIEKGLEQGIKIFIEDKIEDGIAKEEILSKLQKRYDLSEEKAKEYYERFAGNLMTSK